MLKNNYNAIVNQLPDGVKLVAVSKTHPVEMIKACYDLGQRIFGENKVQELLEKQALLPADIQWHLIGHLQTNKVKYIAHFVDTIESVDSEKVLHEIDKQAEKHHRTINVLLQIKIAKEDSKFGLSENEALSLFNSWREGAFPHVKITGLMGMATFTNDTKQVEEEFTRLKNIYDQLNKIMPLETLSMGMSNDFPMAIKCGANSVRVGSAIFGNRNYQ